jgi:V-type H+-transporting ATPase subunit G
MEVPAGQDGIQRLLAAEQEAQAIVAKARQAKAERLKEAKEEAERDVAAYKKEREEEFSKKIADDSSSNKENASRMHAESEKAVAAIQKSIASKKEEVLKMLLSQVETVETV